MHAAYGYGDAVESHGCEPHPSRHSTTTTRRASTHLDARTTPAPAIPAAPALANASLRATHLGTSARLNSSPVTVSSCTDSSRNTYSSSNGSHQASSSLASSMLSTSQQHQPRPTRSLLSRLFRPSKSKSSPKRDSEDERAAASETARHSPILAAGMDALHLRNRSKHRESFGSRAAPYEGRQQHSDNNSSSNDEFEDLQRRGSAPAQTKSNSRYCQSQSSQQQQRAVSYPAATERFPTKKILLEGYLTKLSTHKYWHAKPSYFVLEETILAPATLRVTLRQFRRQHDVALDRSDLVVSEFSLTEDDAVIDISNRYAKHGFELVFTVPKQQQLPSSETASTSIWSALSSSSMAHHQSSAMNAIRSLRLAAPDALSLENWIGVVGSAIAKLVFQSKKHYPIDPLAGRSKLDPPADNNQIATSQSVSAKVVPIMADVGDEEEDLLREEIRQAEQQSEEEEDKASPNPSDREDTPEEQKSLRKCTRCFQWMPYDCDADEQASCCFCGSDACSSDNNTPEDGNESNQEDNQDEEDGGSGQARRQRCDFVSPHTSSATSLTPSDSPSDFVAPQHHSSNNAFANFVVSPNPPAQLTSSSESSVPPYQPTKKAVDQDDPESELKASSTAHSRASSAATAFLRARFPPAHSALHAARRLQMHTFNANGQIFTLDTRYRLVKSIGTGAYGAVIAVKDTVADESVAVKKITNIFEDLVDAKRILREVRLLHHFNHKNITKLLDLSPPISKKHFEDMYIITELMETDLHQVIYSMQPMSDDHVKYFLYQMLCALYHIHSAGVLHRDMKPSNILLNSNCDLKICDFGLARGGVPSFEHAKPQEELTEYVVTRWYRAPEIMLNCLQYTEAIDVWAVGCIFAEMLLREPLFPGNDYIHQLKLIIKFLGTPKQEDIEFVKNVKALRFLTKLPISKPRKWKEVFTGDDINLQAIDLLTQMLIFNPDKRISVEEALQHPYLATFYDPDDITTAPEFDFGFDLPDDKLSKEALVELLCEDIEQFHPPIPKATTTATNASRFFGMGMTASAS